MKPLTARLVGPRRAPPLSALDPRTAAWRADLADLDLAGALLVPTYASAVERLVADVAAPMLARPSPGAAMISELLHGERFLVLDEAHGYAWGRAALDGYVGHVPLHALAPPPAGPVRWSVIGPADAVVLAGPGATQPALAVLPAGARVAAGAGGGSWAELCWGPFAGGHLPRALLDPPALHPVEAALAFLGAPYRWGGRRRAGVDCSGLVQRAFAAASVALGRDSDMQAADAARLGRALGDEPALAGDLLWWPGHVGLTVDGDRMIHAHQQGMAVDVERVDAVMARLAARGGVAQPRRWRLPGLGGLNAPRYGAGTAAGWAAGWEGSRG